MSTRRRHHVVRFEHDDVSQPAPWPVGLRSTLQVYVGLGPGYENAYLVGFSAPGEEKITVLAEAGIADPASVIGMHMVFTDGEHLFTWVQRVSAIDTLTPTKADAALIPAPTLEVGEGIDPTEVQPIEDGRTVEL